MRVKIKSGMILPFNNNSRLEYNEFTGTPIYAGAKAGLLHFVRSIEGQLKDRGIRIVALCPQVISFLPMYGRAGA